VKLGRNGIGAYLFLANSGSSKFECVLDGAIFFTTLLAKIILIG
jgi:hypothetical protein